MLKGNNKRPDILVVEPNVSPVVIETEIAPAAAVEAEAVARLGEKLKANGRTILSALAVRMPARLTFHHGQKLREALAAAQDFEVALYIGVTAAEATRWPSEGWITASVGELSILTQAALLCCEIRTGRQAARHSGISRNRRCMS